jgi:hypothetical protein
MMEAMVYGNFNKQNRMEQYITKSSTKPMWVRWGLTEDYRTGNLYQSWPAARERHSGCCPAPLLLF